jgi:NADPH-dependent 2,4-dienoyl-CoA reductase/sulfur reductase-like enzyme/rhodanese-related sulfurtransferase
MSRKIVVIGGVAAGATAAAKARRTSEEAEITLLEKGDYISFANCGLPYYTGGVITPRGKVILHTPKTYGSRFNADVRVNSEAVGIDRKNRKVTVLSNGKEELFSFDRLVIATGGRSIIPPIKGIDKVPYFSMRTVNDADSVREFVEKNKPESVVIIGGGFIGVETAEAMMHCGLKTTIVEAKPEIMPQMPPIVAMNLREYMEDKGISFKTGVFALEVKKDGKITVSLSDGTALEADMLFLCTGVTPETALAKECGIEIGETGGIAVDAAMRTNDKEIFAAGDAVEKLNLITGKKTLLPLAGPANREGRTAGFNAAVDGDMTFKGIVGTSIVGFDGFCAGQTGLTYEQALAAGFDADYVYTEDADIAEYYPGATFIFMMTVFDKKSGRLLGMSASGIKGVDKRIDSASVAIYAGLTVYDLENLEFAYAPQFAKAKDNLNIAGFVASNKLRGTGFVLSPEEFKEKMKNGVQILDVRSKPEYKNGSVEGAVHIYVNELRDNLDKLDNDKPVFIFCAVGFRGYLAVRVLRNLGYEAYNVTGGIEAIKRVLKAG